MDSKNDKEYLITIKTEYKLLEKKYLKARGKLEKWETRAILAEKKGKLDLQTEANSQAEIIRDDINYITDQLIILKVKMEQELKEIHKLSTNQLSIDPKKLLADMNNLIGNDNSQSFEKEINIIKVDKELEELKKRMES